MTGRPRRTRRALAAGLGLLVLSPVLTGCDWEAPSLTITAIRFTPDAPATASDAASGDRTRLPSRTAGTVTVDFSHDGPYLDKTLDTCSVVFAGDHPDLPVTHLLPVLPHWRVQFRIPPLAAQDNPVRLELQCTYGQHFGWLWGRAARSVEVGPTFEVGVSPAALAFGTLPLDPPRPAPDLNLDLTVSNTLVARREGTGLDIATVEVADELSDPEFTVDPGTCRGATLDGGGSCTATVRFDPGYAGSFAARVRVVRPDGRPVAVVLVTGTAVDGSGTSPSPPPTSGPPTSSAPTPSTSTTVACPGC